MNSNNKFVIWDLFDDMNRCYYHSLKDEFEIYSIGIRKHKENYRQIDLSILNNQLFEQLNQLPLPDIILASPPCNSWSRANTNTTFVENVEIQEYKTNISFKNFEFYDKHNLQAQPSKIRNPISKVKLFLNGFSTALATAEIIKYYKPKYFVIENPQSSKIWKMFNFSQKYIKNLTFYGNYDENFPKKPTIFLSNIDLNLQINKVKNYKNLNSVSRKKRSDIPQSLIKEIVEKFKNDYQNK
ncbi:hypothetical protein [Mycoplasmopsis pullorum]|uniref:DNA (cytosine-5-)-methyltransferase n=1 Tax=Mycoplasmopsis pullorum TaxID=48003 RepID=A0A1L4FSX3_9BACT|nr:hypothetical protein [Mycoplasmopsis pullorum]APJ38694.1 hypothetical protein BLA55_03475 [Mycoplasmopsis pullorum]